MMPPSPGVTKTNFDRIEKGTTMARVEEIFASHGKPVPPDQIDILLDSPPKDRMDWMAWGASDGSLILIHFSGNCVDDKDWQDSGETFLQKIQRWQAR